MEIAKRKEKAKVIDNHQKNFSKAKESFSVELANCEKNIGIVVNNIQNVASLKPGVDELIALQGKFSQVNALKDDLQKKANALMKEDESHLLDLQSDVTSFVNRWENLNDQLKHETDVFCNLQQALTGFTVIQTETVDLLTEFEKTLASLEKSPNDLTEAYVTREKCKELADKVTSSKHYFEKLENSNKNIVQLLKNLPSFQAPEISNDMETIRQRWKNISTAAKDRLVTSDTEIQLWQQIEESKSQLVPWLQETKEDLSNMLANLVDVNAARLKLKSYSEQLKVNRSVSDGIVAKREELLRLNGQRPIHNVDVLVTSLDEGFNELNAVSSQLSALVDDCESKENELKKILKKTVDDMIPIREKLTKCDDVTGSMIPICERLASCGAIKIELERIQPKVADIEKLSSTIVQLNPNYANSNVIKEVKAFKKRYSDISSCLAKIESTLTSLVKKNFRDKLTDLGNSVDVYNSKINLCLPEENYDKDQLLSKFESLNEIVTALAKLDGQKNEVETLDSLLTENNLSEIVAEFVPLKEKVFLGVGSFSEKTDNIKTVLLKHIELMEKYDRNYNKILSDLNKLGGKLNLGGRDLIDDTKIDAEIEKVEDLSSKCSQLSNDIKELKTVEHELSKTDFKPKISKIDTLENKIKVIDDYSKNRSNKLANVVECLSKYNEKMLAMEKFLATTDAQLNQFEETMEKGSKNLEVLRAKLNELKKLSSIKEVGTPLLNEITELSETLFLELIPENRDVMRNKLKNVRASLESLTEKWNFLLKKTESVVLQKTNIEDSSKQILQWITTVEKKVEPETKLKETLPDKRKSWNVYRTLLQDVQSHKPIIEQLVHKMESIPYEETTPDELLARYNKLHDNVGNHVDVLGGQVANHEAYLYNFEKLKDFLDVLRAEEAKCHDCNVDEQISIYESIIPQMKIGNSIVEECEVSLKPVLLETNDAGKEALTGELSLQKKNLMEFAEKCETTLEKLVKKRNRDEKLRGSVSVLDDFLKNVESKLKDQSLKSNLDAKKKHLQEIKVAFDSILSKNDEFSLLKSEASEASPELTETSLKLVDRYQNAKQKAKVI